MLSEQAASVPLDLDDWVQNVLNLLWWYFIEMITSADHIEIAEEPGPLDIATNDDGRRLEPWYKDDEELVRLVSG